MNTRPLTDLESKNLAALNASGCESVLLFVTATGLEKSILDATEPIRRLLKKEGIHDFSNQKQGQENKILKQVVILGSLCNEETIVSLYRPNTKKGDPRLWFKEFKRQAEPNDVCAILAFKGILHLLNLTKSRVSEEIEEGRQSCAAVFIQKAKAQGDSIALELLGLLRGIACKGPLKAVCSGDTAIGRSIETALGIQINSSRNPDFNGIELKSGRSKIAGRQNKATLFACVPNWNISGFKSSSDILDRFGYQRGSDFKLYCTVSSKKANSQGLQLSLDSAQNWLKEVYRGREEQDVCIWELERLHSRLAEKHNETFWIKAKSILEGSQEYFCLESVTHTARPSAEQFDRLLENGAVTLDHLIKRNTAGRCSEKGPLFRIERPRLQELFLGQPKTYSLLH